jgi:hypothetical protein
VNIKGATALSPYRHPELVSGSIYPPAMPPLAARWMLKQVQHDGSGVARFAIK